MSTIHNIIPECLDAIYKVLQPNYFFSAIVEQSFGILAARFRILFREINADEGLVDKIINTTVVLHNFIRKTGTCRIVPMSMDNTAFAPLVGERLASRNSSVYANFLRDIFKDFLFNQN